jgi:nickel-dependent lactate racemase
MRVRLEYGRTGLEVELPDRNVVKCLGYQAQEPLADPTGAVHDCLARPTGTPPLAELARGRSNACVVISDVTRPVPNAALLRPILNTLHESGIARDRILILVATGLHRPNLGQELAEMVGREIAESYGSRLTPASARYLLKMVGLPVWVMCCLRHRAYRPSRSMPSCQHASFGNFSRATAARP